MKIIWFLLISIIAMAMQVTCESFCGSIPIYQLVAFYILATLGFKYFLFSICFALFIDIALQRPIPITTISTICTLAVFPLINLFKKINFLTYLTNYFISMIITIIIFCSSLACAFAYMRHLPIKLNDIIICHLVAWAAFPCLCLILDLFIKDSKIHSFYKYQKDTNNG